MKEEIQVRVTNTRFEPTLKPTAPMAFAKARQN
jgi:hypothetical protein